MSENLQALALIISAIAAIIAFSSFRTGLRNRDIDMTRRSEEKLEAAIKGLDEKLTERIDARQATQDKARHDLANNITTQLTEQRRDLADLRAKAVTREDMAGLKSEMKADFVRLESKIDRLLEVRIRVPAAE